MTIQLFNSILQVSPSQWASITVADFPFMSHSFLRALETTECLGRRTGWSPLYLTAWDGAELQGAMVSFVKTNSYGEYIFDFAWAQASQAYGIPYYPKLVSATPFTPATGSKLLCRSGASLPERSALTRHLLQAWLELTAKLGASSAHALFIPEGETAEFVEAGFFVRHSFQYHWRNRDYAGFSDFLGSLKGKRRREINRERSQVHSSQVKIERLTGEHLTQAHAEIFYSFYLGTVEKRGGNEYLTRSFFQEIFASMKAQLLLVLARDAFENPVAGALYYIGSDTLYGRHWGCLEEHKALHFELCYYQGIEFAIENRMRLFEAGAQGEHKFNRGFMPSLTYSAHSIRNREIRALVNAFVEEEKLEIARIFDSYEAHSPFNQSVKDSPDGDVFGRA